MLKKSTIEKNNHTDEMSLQIKNVMRIAVWPVESISHRHNRTQSFRQLRRDILLHMMIQEIRINELKLIINDKIRLVIISLCRSYLNHSAQFTGQSQSASISFWYFVLLLWHFKNV